VAVLSGLGFAGVAKAATYYVKPTGNDANSGTSEGLAWRTVQRATDSPVGPGDTVFIRSGTYTGIDCNIGSGFDFVMCPPSGSPGNPVVYKGYPGDVRPRIHGDTTYGRADGKYISCISAVGSNWIVFDSLEITHGMRRGIFTSGAKDIVIRNCVFDTIGVDDVGGNNQCAIGAGEGVPHITQRILVENCEFFHITLGGVYVYDMDSLVVRNCVFRDNESAIFLKISAGKIDSAIHIYNNVISRTPGSRFGSKGMNLGLAYTLVNLFVHHNVIYGQFRDAAIQVNTNTDASEDFRHRRIYIYNNTIDCSAMGSAGVQTELADFSGSYFAVDTFEIFNNIFYAPEIAGGGFQEWGVFSQFGKTTSSGTNGTGKLGPGFVWDYNLIYDITSTGVLFRWWESGAGENLWTHAQWKANTNDGDHDVLANPLFANVAAHDYHIPGSSAAASGGRGGAWPTYRGAFPPSGPDTTKPTITSPSSSNVTGCSATIKWRTNESATSDVDFGLTSLYELGTVNVPGYVDDHTVVLNNLLPLINYFYRIRSQDGSGNSAAPVTGSFSTTADACNIASGILAAVSASYPGYSPAIITDGVIDAYGGEGTTWASDDGTASADWIEIDFGTANDVENLTIHWAWNPFLSAWMTSQQYQIQYWNGSSYTTLTTVNAPAAGNATSTNLPSTNTDRIRILQPAAMGPSTYPGVLWVTEVQVFGIAQADTLSPAAVIDLR
jgi:hypothetical protein